MDTLFFIALALSGPIFYITGLITFIRYLSRSRTPRAPAVVTSNLDPHSGSQPTSSLSYDVAPLRLYAMSQPSKISKELLRIADDLERSAPSYSVQAAGRHLGAPTGATLSSSPVPPVGQPATTSWTGLSVDDALHQLDNINLILYLGAFLVVVSAGIFVGVNFETLSGDFKTVFLGLFAAVFYGVGLTLFLRSKKLRPAGVTFTGIGLVLLPLVGLAAYNFTYLHDFGPATWFVTSLLTFAAYVITLMVTRQTYVAYLMSFTALSLFESTVSLLNLPVYWFGWVMAVVSIVLLAFSSTKYLWQEANSALFASANVLLPLSLLLSIAAAGDHGLAQIGLTVGLAGIFYGAMAKRFVAHPNGEAYWVAALISLPIAINLGLWEMLSRYAIGIMVLAISGIYLLIEHVIGTRISERWHHLLAGITGLLPLAGIAVAYDQPGHIVVALALAALINGELAWRQRQTALALLAVMSLLALPFVFGRLYLDPALGWGSLAAITLAEVPLLVWWRHKLTGWPDSGNEVGILGYMGAQFLAMLYAATAGSTQLLATGLAVTALLYGLSWYERAPNYLYGAAATLYLSVIQLSGIGNLDPNLNTIFITLIGGILYACGWLEVSGPARTRQLRYAGLTGPFLGALIGLVLAEPNLAPVAALAAGGGLLWLEARRQDSVAGQEAAGGILVLAFNWLVYQLQLDQFQFYSLPWAAYIAYLAYRRRSQGREVVDPLVGIALGVLTIPLAAQALGDDGQIYGLLLIFESLALVFAGMAVSYRLITLWGVTVLVLEVLYQLRDVFYALPKYLISAALGLALLAVAIVLLQRRHGDD